MLNAIAGTWPVDEGSILIDGVDVTGLPEFKRASFLGRVFQDPMTGTTATMQIDENLALAARRGQHRGLKWGITKKEKAQFHELLKTLELGLEDRMTSKVGLLSGGQRQDRKSTRLELQSPMYLVCRLLLEKKKINNTKQTHDNTHHKKNTVLDSTHY